MWRPLLYCTGAIRGLNVLSPKEVKLKEYKKGLCLKVGAGWRIAGSRKTGKRMPSKWRCFLTLIINICSVQRSLTGYKTLLRPNSVSSSKQPRKTNSMAIWELGFLCLTMFYQGFCFLLIGPLCISYGFQFCVFMGFLRVNMCVSASICFF